jgi:hypothetical protein
MAASGTEYQLGSEEYVILRQDDVRRPRVEFAHGEMLFNENARRAWSVEAYWTLAEPRCWHLPSAGGMSHRKKFGSPRITNDGVTTQRDQKVDDQFERSSAGEVSKTNDT